MNGYGKTIVLIVIVVVVQLISYALIAPPFDGIVSILTYSVAIGYATTISNGGMSQEDVERIVNEKVAELQHSEKQDRLATRRPTEERQV